MWPGISGVVPAAFSLDHPLSTEPEFEPVVWWFGGVANLVVW